MKTAELLGVWRVEKMMSVIGSKPGLYTREEVEADLDEKLKKGEIDEDEKKETLMLFSAETEFCGGGTVKTWFPIPEGTSEEEIREALKSGEISEVKDGKMLAEEKKWEEKDDGVYLDSGEYREALGERLSSLDKLELDEAGLLPYGGGAMILKKK